MWGFLQYLQDDDEASDQGFDADDVCCIFIKKIYIVGFLPMLGLPSFLLYGLFLQCLQENNQRRAAGEVCRVLCLSFFLLYCGLLAFLWLASFIF